jgi:hypothetical protein
MNQAWLKAIDWSAVTAINQQLCAAKQAQHGPTSDGHAPARALWEKTHVQAITLDALVELCRKCHQLAPFLNYNGNTFVVIARQVIGGLPLGAQAAVLRSLAGHIIAGTATPEEQKAFQTAVAKLTAKPSA